MGVPDDMRPLAERVEELFKARGQGAEGAQGAGAQAGSLNWLMEQLTVGLLPPSRLGRVLDVRSDASLEEAIRQLAQHGILSAPVRDISAAEDASWIDRYLGIVDFPGVVLWVLNHHSVRFLATPRTSADDRAFPPASTAPEAGTTTTTSSSSSSSGSGSGSGNGAGGPEEDLFSLLQSSQELRSCKVSDVVGSFRWAPFLPLTRDDSLLTLLLMVSAYRARAVPVVEVGQGPLANIATQTTVAHVLSACMGLPCFQAWAGKPIAQLGLPAVARDQMVTVEESDPVLEPFRLMQRRGIGGVPVLRRGSRQVVGSISVRDIQLLLLHPRLLHQHSTLVVAEFMQLARDSLPAGEATAVQRDALTVPTSVTLGALLQHMEEAHCPRAYVTDESGDLLGVVTLRDVIAGLVQEPPGYFGDFFQGVVPISLTNT